MQSEPNEPNEIAESLQQALRALTAGDYGAAEILFQQTLKRAGDHGGAAQMCLHHLSKMSQERGNFDEAIRFSLRSLTLTRQVSGEDSEQVVSSMVHLAELYQTSGKYDEAGDLYFRAKVISEKLVFSKGEDETEADGAGENSDTPEMSDRLRKVFAKRNKGAGDDEKNEDGTSAPQKEWQAEEEEETFNFKANEEQEKGRSGSGSGLSGVSRADSKDQPVTGISRKRSGDDDEGGHHKFQEPDQSAEKQRMRPQQDFSKDDLAALNQRVRGVAPSETAPQFREEQKRSGSRYSADSDGAQSSARNSSARNSNASSDKIKNLRTDKEEAADFGALLRYVQEMIRSLGIHQLAWSIVQHFKNKNNVIAAIIGAVVFIGAIAGWALTIPVKTQPLEAYLSMPHKFRTTDGDIIVDLPDSTKCDLTVDGSTTSAPMSCYVGDWRDACRMVMLSFVAKQIYFDLQGQRLVDDDGTTFFPCNGKVVKLVTQMEMIADGASDWFIKTKQYPTSVGEFARDRAQSEFENAFTNSAQLPLVQTVQMPVAPNQAQALSQLHSLYRTLGQGGSWQNEPPMRPGMINCCSMIVPFPDGAARAFLIQAGDESSKPLIGGHPNTHFFLALEDGKPADYDEQYKLESNQMSIRPRMIWIDQSKDPDYITYIRFHASGLLFLAISLILVAVLCLFSRVRRPTKMVLIFAVTICLFFTGIYFMESSFP